MSISKKQVAAAVIVAAVATQACSTAGAVKDIALSDNPLQAGKDKVTAGVKNAKDLATAFTPTALYQKALNIKGCEAGTADGQIGAGTVAAHERLVEANDGLKIATTALAVGRAPKGCK